MKIPEYHRAREAGPHDVVLVFAATESSTLHFSLFSYIYQGISSLVSIRAFLFPTSRVGTDRMLEY